MPPEMTIRSSTESASRPNSSAGRTTTKSISSSKYHLLTRNVWTAANLRCRRAAVPGLAMYTRYEIAIPVSPIAAPITSPTQEAMVLGCAPGAASLEPVNAGARNFPSTSSTPDTSITPPTTAATASMVIATFIGHSRSAITCSGPGKPTSVSSSSPVIGLRGTSAWARWPCSSSTASGQGLPKNALKIIRNVYRPVRNAPT